MKYVQDFDEWFKENGFSCEHRMILAIAWDAAIDSADLLLQETEQKRFYLKEALKSS